MCTPHQHLRPRAAALRGRSRYPGADLRVSDAERTAVADRLSKHYADGRLDQSEFNERLDQAMKAKTQSDLAGLFDDLPGTDAAAVLVPSRARRGIAPHQSRALILLLVLGIIALAAQAWVHANLWWIAVATIVFLWLRGSHHQRRR
jgi:Flp pilus assembly protein TadB